MHPREAKELIGQLVAVEDVFFGRYVAELLDVSDGTVSYGQARILSCLEYPLQTEAVLFRHRIRERSPLNYGTVEKFSMGSVMPFFSEKYVSDYTPDAYMESVKFALESAIEKEGSREGVEAANITRILLIQLDILHKVMEVNHISGGVVL